MLPMQWQRFIDSEQLAPGADLIPYLHNGLFSGDAARVECIARAWEAWSSAVVMFSLEHAADGVAGDIASAIAKTRIEMHYAQHRYFLADDQLLNNAGRLPRVPTTIIHGARDLTCPAEAAWAVHRAIPGAKLEILRTAGHLSSETPIIDALVRAADDMAAVLGAN